MPIEPTRGSSPYGEKRRHRRGLREAVALEDRDAEPLLELLVHLDRQRRRRRRRRPAGSPASCSTSTLVGLVERAEQAPVHRRHAGEEGDLLLLHQRQRRRRPRSAAAARRCRRSAKPAFCMHGLAEGVEQRQHAQVACRGCPASAPKSAVAGERVVAHVAVPQLGALGLAGGAGGVEDDRGVVLVGRDGLERRRLLRRAPAPSVSAPSIGDARGRVGGDHEEVLAARRPARSPAYPSCADRQLGGALEAEVGLRVGVVEVVGDLAALEQHVERDDGRAGLEDAVVDDREVRQVRAAQRDLVAGLDAARDQQVGHLVGRARRPAA